MADICPICLQNLNPIPMGEKNGYVLISCRACGSVMTQKPVTPEEREQFLAEIEPQITHIPNPQAEINSIKKLISSIMPDGKGKSFIDVNCRNGYAVMAARELGFNAKGIDTHAFFIEFAQSKYPAELFEQASIHDAASSGFKADFVYSREGFGDQIDPDGFARDLAAIIAPKGVLYVEEPDGNGFNTPRYFAGWQVVFPPMNFIYLSKVGLTSLLKRHGIRIQKRLFNWRPLIRVIASAK